MKITDIEPQKRKKARVNLYLDGQFYCGLATELVFKHHLEIGDEVGEKNLENLLFEDQGEKAYGKALFFLNFRPRSRKEVHDKLVEKEFDGKIIELVLARLEKNGFLNDLEFAKSWIRDKKQVSPQGKYRISRELGQKGVEKEVIDAAFLSEFQENDELEMALALGKKKLALYKNLPKREKNDKISAALARRGFSWDVIKKVLLELE